MKKFILTILVFFMTVSTVLADTVHNLHGEKITGKIEGVVDGVIYIKNKGNTVSIIRPEMNPVYLDSVKARRHLISGQIITYKGKILFADNMSVKIKCANEQVIIPKIRVKEIIMYVP